MRPHNEEFTGAIWYKTILQNASCPWDGASEYFVQPDGFETGDDALNFAVVMPSAGYFVELYSGGKQILRSELHAGLNYGTLPGLQPGWQRMHIVDSAGNIKRVAAGGRCVSSGCPDCVYNMNPQVVPLSDNTEDNGQCPDTRCGGVNVYVPGSIWKDDPIMQCIPPCTFILPAYQLSTNTTITWPVLTTTVWSILEGSTITKLTSFTIPPFTTDEVRFWTVTADKTDTVKTTVIPRTSIMPPPVTVTLPPDVATFAPTRVGKKTHSPPIFYSTPHIETIQPQPTITITSLPVFPTITFSSAKPTATCTSNCGFYDCSPFGCPPSETDDDDDDDDDPDGIVLPICGLFACDGGCDSFFGCGKGCGIRGCGNQNSNDDGWCPLSACGGLGCLSGSCGSNSNEPTSTSEPCTTQTASACTTACVDASCSTVCATTRACTATGTSTIFFGTPAPAEALDSWELPLISRSDLVRSGAALTEYRDWLAEQVPISAPGATVTTNNPPATTTTMAPDPTATSYVLLLSKAVTEQVSDDLQRTAWSWLVYEIPTNQKYDQCDFDDLTLHEEPYSKENSGWDSSADKVPEHPTHLEFDLKMYKGCAYESNSNEDVGHMKCDGLPSVTCKETSVHDKVWQCGDWTTVVELIECQYMY
ncbi:hypothetical protein MPH_09243 [Macrophomina phaseolina MS6]|uniref:Uncharacterized protein n=1 Tax=Macrophomina phaseolina (strain MS6) TaxID=1126212 RepID=K2RTW0_MACPH|nr:hypothetical protein MPH_09243 [Macrophomina phaseolina MS6]